MSRVLGDFDVLRSEEVYRDIPIKVGTFLSILRIIGILMLCLQLAEDYWIVARRHRIRVQGAFQPLHV